MQQYFLKPNGLTGFYCTLFRHLFMDCETLIKLKISNLCTSIAYF